MFVYIPDFGFAERLFKWRYLNWLGRLDAVGQVFSQLSAVAFVMAGIGTLLVELGAGHPSSSGRWDLVVTTLVSAGIFILSNLVRTAAKLAAGIDSPRNFEKPLPARSATQLGQPLVDNQRLVLKRRLARRSAKLWPLLWIGFLSVGVASLVMVAEHSTGVEVAGLVGLMGFAVLETWLFISGRRRSQRIYEHFPTFEATKDELRMTNSDGFVAAARRNVVERVVQLQTQDLGGGATLQFRDASERELARWDLDRYTKRAVIKWVRHLGYKVDLLGGERAREAIDAGDTPS